MFLADWKREWDIRRILRQLAQQRVAMVLQPGNVWVIEKAVQDTKESDAALKTCYMRGWVEPIKDSIPKGMLQPDGSLPELSMFQSSGPVWRLTDSGWAAIQRAHEWTLFGILVALISVFLALK